jgi:hypothetical protein
MEEHAWTLSLRKGKKEWHFQGPEGKFKTGT